MASETAAKRYTKALFDLATSQEKMAVVAKDLETLRELIEASDDLASFLTDSVLPPPAVEKTLQTLLADKVDSLTLQFLLFLVEKNRLAITLQVCTYFAKMVDEAEGIGHATIVAAKELEDSQLDAIGRRLRRKTGLKTILFQVTLDPSLIAGFTVHLGDQVIDLSMKTQLESLHDRILHA